jgi:hypothetical protein
MRFYLIYIGLFYSLSTCAQINVRLTPNPVVFGQEVKLIIQQSQVVSKGLPDISALSRDFEITGTQESMSYQIINGQTSRNNIWTIILYPKHPGQIKLPELDFNGDKTPSLDLNVQASNMVNNHPLSDGGHEDVYMTWEVSPVKPLLHEKVDLVIKIYHTMPLLDARLSPPHLANGLIINLDASSQQLEVIGGKRYQIESSHFVIYPQKVGQLKIHPPVLDALEYGMMPTPIHKTLPIKSLHVQPIPNHISQSNWLPAKHLSFEELKPLAKKIGVAEGDTIVRQIRIKADGIPAQLIPDIQPTCKPDCKVYINPPKIDNQVLNGQLYGEKIFDITYLPNQSGKNELSAIDIPWYDIQSKQEKVLHISAIDFDVLHKSPKTPPQMTSSPKPPTSPAIYIMFSFIMGGICVWGWRRIRLTDVVFYMQEAFEKNRALKKACLQNDPNKLKPALLLWARKEIPDAHIIDLNDLLVHIPDGDMHNQIKLLITYLYSQQNHRPFNGPLFWRVFKSFSWPKPPKIAKNQHDLGLNP